MNIARIVSITPAGKPWESQYGLMHPFTVSFDDAMSGEANCKSAQTPYKVGEVAGYDITGQTPRGVNKIKITRNPDPSKGRFTGLPDAENMPGDPVPVQTPPRPPQARSVAQNSPPEPLKVNLPLGQTVGMAIKLAGDMLLSEDPKLINEELWQVRLHACAQKIIAVSRSLENDTPLEETPF